MQLAPALKCPVPGSGLSGFESELKALGEYFRSADVPRAEPGSK